MQKQSRKIKVATLNYSGIITSPFEYHEDPDDQEEITRNNVFVDIVKRYHNPNYEDAKKFSWEMGNVDVIWKTRYSPINKVLCGVQIVDQDIQACEKQLQKQGKISGERKMMKLNEYSQRWDSRLEPVREDLKKFYFQKYREKKEEEIMQLMETHLNNTKIFDILAFRTFAKIIYGNEQIQNWDVSADKWIQVRKEQFNKIYLDDQKKRYETLNILKKGEYDIFCFQETNKKFRELLNSDLTSYWLRSFKDILSCDSIIVLKKETFPQITCHEDLDDFNKKFIEQHIKIRAIHTVKVQNDKTKEKQWYFFDRYANKQHFQDFQKEINWNFDTAFQVLDNLIVFCPHITSKKQKNAIQQEQMFKNLQEIRRYNPQFSFICAGDYNSQIQQNSKMIPQYKNKKLTFKIFPPPGSSQHITCNKKRTLLQPQRHKAEKLDTGTKDYIVTNMEIQQSKIMMINGEEITSGGKKALLPNNKHPYDHYIATCTINQVLSE